MSMSMLATTLLVLQLCACCVGVTGDHTARHVAILLVDDLGYGDTGHMGAEYPTAAIDSLALGGVRLNQSYVMQLCSPTRSSLLTSRYSYAIGMDGSVLISGDARCMPFNASTVGEQMMRNGVKTALIGKYDAGYSSWQCTPNCRGFEYWLGYYGAAEDYYNHGGGNTLDFHENFDQAPQYRGEYSTHLFARKASEWIQNTTGGVAGANTTSTFLYLAFQAVHGPIESPPSEFTSACGHIVQATRRTYCEMMQAVDSAVANVTSTYKTLGIFDSTVFLFIADNGGTNQDGGFNVPLRGQKATVWEGGVRAQTFVYWSGFPAHVRGSVYSGLAHVSDWGVTLVSALGFTAVAGAGELPYDGIDLWRAIANGTKSPRTEMLLSMRDSGDCATAESCPYPGQLAYRKGAYKLIYGHTALRGAQGGECAWSSNGDTLNCWNGWGIPHDSGPPRPPTVLPPRPGQPPNTSLYSWGGIFLFNIEEDPLEEHDLSAEEPDIVADLIQTLRRINATQIDQDVHHEEHVNDTESCGVRGSLSCSIPWLPSVPGDVCRAQPTPPMPPPAPSGHPPSHLTESVNWIITPAKLTVHGWVCYARGSTTPSVMLQADESAPINVSINGTAPGGKTCSSVNIIGKFQHTFQAAAGVDFTHGYYQVSGHVVVTHNRTNTTWPLGDSPACVRDCAPTPCKPNTWKPF